MAEKMNPPPLGVARIRDLEELQRLLSIYIKHQTDASPMWNEYVWSYAVEFYELYYKHYSAFPDFVDHAKDAAQHNAVVSTVEVIRKQMYNFNSLQSVYERQIFERVGEYIRREDARRGLRIAMPAPPVPNPLGLTPLALGRPTSKLPSINFVSTKRHAFVDPLLAEKGWSVADWAAKANVSRHTANDYLEGKRRTYHTSLRELAKALDVSFQHFPK